MRMDLDHLSPATRRELELVVEILFAEFQDAIVLGTQSHKKLGRILKVILYGSTARGERVDDPIGGYTSDYDLLVVVNHDRLTDMVEYWAKADEHLMRQQTIGHRLSAPVSLIVHSLADVNKQLQRGRPFFIDLVRDGVVLYEAPGHPFVQPEPLSPAEALKEAQGYFDYWLPLSMHARQLADASVTNDVPRDAAFMLHQATERAYHGLLLTLNLYSPKSHKLNFLRSQAEHLDTRLTEAWPRATKFEQRCFELLRRAYVDARYSPQYKISVEELAWLGKQVSVLQVLVKRVCEDRLDVLRAEA